MSFGSHSISVLQVGIRDVAVYFKHSGKDTCAADGDGSETEFDLKVTLDVMMVGNLASLRRMALEVEV